MGLTMRGVFWIIIFIIGCSQFKSYNHIDPEFYPYIQKWEKRSGKTFNVKIGFVDGYLFSKNIVGQCNYINRTITIKKSYWKKASDKQKESLFLHEIGHCIYYRGHYDITYEFTDCPKSIMHWQTIPQACLDHYWEYYLKEFYEYK